MSTTQPEPQATDSHYSSTPSLLDLLQLLLHLPVASRTQPLAAFLLQLMVVALLVRICVHQRERPPALRRALLDDLGAVDEGLREAVAAFPVISFRLETHIKIGIGIGRRAGDRSGVALLRGNGLNSIGEDCRTVRWRWFDWVLLTTSRFEAKFIKEVEYHGGILEED